MLAMSWESVAPKQTHQKDLHSPDSSGPFHKSPFQQRLQRHDFTQCFRSLVYYGHHLLGLSPLLLDNAVPWAHRDPTRNNTFLSLPMALVK